MTLPRPMDLPEIRRFKTAAPLKQWEEDNTPLVRVLEAMPRPARARMDSLRGRNPTNRSTGLSQDNGRICYPRSGSVNWSRSNIRIIALNILEASVFGSSSAWLPVIEGRGYDARIMP
jgi:hypothetical protein